MSTFTNNDVAPGAVVQASDHNSQGAALAAVINGGIDNSNIAANAAIAGSKLADDSVATSKIDWTSGIWWEELGRTTLSVAGDTISVTPIAERKYLKIIVLALATGGTVAPQLRFNNDSSNNYAYRRSVNGAADTTATTTNAFNPSPVNSTPVQLEVQVLNIETQEKVGSSVGVGGGTAGVANAPDRIEGSSKWVNTTAQITRVDAINGGAGDFAIGSTVIVLGHD